MTFFFSEKCETSQRAQKMLAESREITVLTVGGSGSGTSMAPPSGSSGAAVKLFSGPMLGIKRAKNMLQLWNWEKKEQVCLQSQPSK